MSNETKAMTSCCCGPTTEAIEVVSCCAETVFESGFEDDCDCGCEDCDGATCDCGCC